MNLSADAIRAVVEKHTCSDLDWCASYSDPEKGILFADWNDVPSHITDWLENHGYELEWLDEWIIDYNNNCAYRTSPDSYGWKPSYVLTEDGEIIGREAVLSGDEIDVYIEHLLNDAGRADCFDVDWSAHGFERLNEHDFESGFHPGQNDNPSKILAAAQAKDPNRDYLFQIGSVGQFDMRFSIWGRKQD